MRWNDIYIDSMAAALGRKELAAAAVAEGRYDAGEHKANGYRAVRVMDEDRAAIESAVDAATLALKRTSVNHADIVLAAHASVGYQGMEHFAPASYVQGKSLGGEAMAVEIRQFSNGGLALLQMGAAYLTVSRPGTAALLVTSDKFVPPAYDRYRSDRGIAFGDGGTAVVLSRRPGVARLLSTAVISDGAHGAVYIGDEPWNDGESGGTPVDLRSRRQQYLASNADLLMEVIRSMTARQAQTARMALADAGCDSREISRWVFSNVGETQVDSEFRRAFHVTNEKTAWEWGREAGHLGAGDQFGGLAHLLETGAVHGGDKIALCSIGMGFSYGCAVVEIVDEPEWTSSTD